MLILNIDTCHNSCYNKDNLKDTHLRFKGVVISMANIFYARVSTEEQNEGRQLVNAAESQYSFEKVFIDKCSGKNTDRPELKKMLEYIREGDTVVISEFSRLARSTKDMLNLTDELTSKGVEIVSLKEKIDTSSPCGKFMLTVFAALAELERETILQRQREGIQLAKSEGRYKGRPFMKFDENKFRSECAKWLAGEQTGRATAAAMGMSVNTFYRRCKDLGIEIIKK